MQFFRYRKAIFVSLFVLTCQAARKMSLHYGYTADDIVHEGRLTHKEIADMQQLLKLDGFHNLLDEQVVQFLLSCDKNVECTKKSIKSYFSCRDESEDIFLNRDVDSPELKDMLDIAHFNIIPRRTKDNSTVILFKLTSSDFTKYNTAASMKIVSMAMDAAINDYPPTSLIMIFDVERMTFMHMFAIKLGVVMRYLTYLQEGLPVKLKNIHVLNMKGTVDKLVNWLMPLMKESVRRLLLTYPKSYNMNKFYEEAVERECLPSDYGGFLPSVEDLNVVTIEKLRNLKDYFIAEEEQRKIIANRASSINKNVITSYLSVLIVLLLTIPQQ